MKANLPSVSGSVALIAGIAGLCFSCAPSEPIRPRNVLLITIDTLRSDHCSVYGYQRETTPTLSAFAAEGARFDLAYAPTSTTGPTHASIFTSLYPVSHGVVKNGIILSDDLLTLAELLRDQGFETGGFVSSMVLEEKYGYARGFETYDTEFSSVSATIKDGIWVEDTYVVGGFDRRAHETTNRAMDWLETGRDSSRPFFAFVHYFDPHHPYQPMGRFRTMFPPERRGAAKLDEIVSLYDGEIAFTDEQIGRLLEALGDAARDTLVVITADHGEGLLQHGYLHHGVHIYEELVRVPLLWRWPEGIPAGQVFEAPVELVDVAPTIVDLLGLEADTSAFQGRSLAAALRGDAELPTDRPVYLLRRHYKEGVLEGQIPVKGTKLGLRYGDWKYIVGTDDGSVELFDLASDPGERNNLSDELPEKVEELAAHLKDWMRVHGRTWIIREELSDQDRKRLEALGYVE